MSTLGVPPKPSPFLTVRTHRIDLVPTLCALCAGYENGSWRAAGLADHIVEWLPEFALSPAEWTSMQHANSVEMIRRAARTVYQTDKFKSRGEFGELLLHVAVRQIHDSIPAISKIYYKTAVNDTVKGFDAVHVVGPPNNMELWLGEAKFYEDIDRAIGDVVKEIQVHLETDYLRTEFILIANKIDDTWPHSAQLRRLLSANTSLDEVFQRACIPVLLTYDSECMGKHQRCSAEFSLDFEREVAKHYQKFAASISRRVLPAEIRIHLFLMPLFDKKSLVGALERKLKLWQHL
jgi:hypothetical protein